MNEEEIVLLSPDEILAMQFDPADLYLPNGIFAKGQSFTILGPAGAGKSRLLLQMYACFITGRPFLGWPVQKQEMRWVVLQTENSNRRFHADLQRFKAWLSEKEWKAVNANLRLQTMGVDHTFWNLSDDNNKTVVAQLLVRERPGVLVVDPLIAYKAGNLNTDDGMMKTCHTLSDLAKYGEDGCSVIVLHHTLSGKEGMRKAVGFDRASYGRGSKALNMWTRGQLNVAPASETDNTRLVISCGKNSNGPDFIPFGIMLNPTTMVYEVDPSFDLGTWKASLSGDTVLHSIRKPTPMNVALLLKGIPLTRKALKDRVMKEFACGQSNAYRIIAAAEGKTIKRNPKRQYEAV